jgi:transcriptional regulator with XRE-family HTH domain
MTDSPLQLAELPSLINEKLNREGLKLRQASINSGVSAATLSRVIHGKVPDTATFAALVRWLGVSADRFIDRGDATPEQPLGGADLIEAHLRADRTLPPATAQALAALVRAAYADFGRPSSAGS